MKIAVVLFALLGIAFGAQLPLSYNAKVQVEEVKASRNLMGDLQDLLDLFPPNTEQVAVLIIFGYLEDPQVQALLNYLFSPRFAALYLHVYGQPELQYVLGVLTEGGIPVAEWEGFIRDFLGIPRSTVLYDRSHPITKAGLQGLIYDLLALVPLGEVIALVQDKYVTSSDFHNLVEVLRSPYVEGGIIRLAANPEVQFIVANLRAWGVDVDLALEILRQAFGWNI